MNGKKQAHSTEISQNAHDTGHASALEKDEQQAELLLQYPEYSCSQI